MKKLILLITSGIAACLIIYTTVVPHLKASNISDDEEYYYNENTNLNEDGSHMSTSSVDKSVPVMAHPIQIDTVKDSITVLVNKEYSLPSDYIPIDLVVPDVLFNINYYDEKKLMRQEAATALEELFKAASSEGLSLYGISGYRSYARQEQIYNTNIRTKGEEYTNRYSARPGFSEHQTGLVLDVSTASIANRLEPVFAYTPEGKWLDKNAYKYGFIIRYPKDKESITGYSYEPWHLRYVGKALAKDLFDNNLSLEEYYGYEPSEIFSEDISYDNVVDVDESTEKKELSEPTQEQIDKASGDSEKDPIPESDKDIKGKTKSDEIKPDETKTDETKTDEIKPDDTKTDDTKTDDTKIDKTITDKNETDKIETKPEKVKDDSSTSKPTKENPVKDEPTTVDPIPVPEKSPTTPPVETPVETPAETPEAQPDLPPVEDVEEPPASTPEDIITDIPVDTPVIPETYTD